ncbi:MAG TPA: dethiobiotin synthase [Kineosporiaceae bacterium]
MVTGTDTGVGKTVVTAAIAAAAAGAGLQVAVVKPAQTGTATGEEGDARTVRRLAAPVAVQTLAEYPDPLAPSTAARVSGRPALILSDVTERIRAQPGDLVLIEGAGGLLVPMGHGGWTMADLAERLHASVVVVARAGLGTLNHTALTLHALARHHLPTVVLIGAWPAVPDLVHRTNLHDLPGTLAGAVPAGAGSWEPPAFRGHAHRWVAPVLHGSFDAAALRGPAG